MNKPKVLFYDIESSPIKGLTWGIWEQNVIAIEKDWELLSMAFKWKGEKTIHCVSRRQYTSEKELVKKTHKILQDADVIIAHNGDEFDIKKLNAKFVEYNLEPLHLMASVDTKKVAKRYFKFTSNSLNELGKLFGLGEKLDTGGIKLWQECMKGNATAFKKMERYNKQDVVLLEKVYNRMKPWMTNHPSLSLLSGYKGCPTCASKDVIKKGIRGSHSGIRQQMQCKDCHGWFLVSLNQAKHFIK